MNVNVNWAWAIVINALSELCTAPWGMHEWRAFLLSLIRHDYDFLSHQDLGKYVDIYER